MAPMEKITLIQPRHSNAPENGNAPVYLPSSLLTVFSRLQQAGVEVNLDDHNLHPFTPNHLTDSLNIGINLVGAPYIPVVIQLRQKIEETLGKKINLFLGGQPVNGLSKDQLHRLFGSQTFNGNNDHILKHQLGIDLRHLPQPEETSLIPAYEKLSDEDFKQYMSREFCLYLSQGCKYGCSFCGAKHTSINPVSGAVTKEKEIYRNLHIVEEELNYLVNRARKLGINHFEIYLSNLDLFQTPQKLKQFAQIILKLKQAHSGHVPGPTLPNHAPGDKDNAFTFRIRGLSTAKAFMDTYRQSKETITSMVDAGLWAIGFGVDGVSQKVWKQIKKGHNRKNECVDAIRLTRREFGITPEVFMVVGHAQDTQETMLEGVEFLLDMSEHYQAPPRPYVAKNIIPGNDAWLDPRNREYVENLIQHPEYFQLLDYAALPSPLTHPNPVMRHHIEEAFRMITEIPGNTTNLIYPVYSELGRRQAEIRRRLNAGKTDR